MITIKKHNLLEQKQYDQPVRTIVKDIIKLYKSEGDGEYYLPEELEEDILEYEFPKFSLSVELILEPSDMIDDFIVDAELFREDNVISVTIKYNPEKKSKITYDLIGELNEIVAHEMRHIVQKDRTEFNLEKPAGKGVDYYTSPEEIDAQVFGFRRMARITKRPFTDLVRNWFRTHKDLHTLSDEEQEIVVNKLLDYNSKI
jgi:hypothetical protein